MDLVLDDPGELLRFWLWYQKRVAVRTFTIANLAKALRLKPATVGAWLGRHAIPTMYWNRIARYFERASYRDIEDDAIALWANADARRGYIPLHRLQVKRAATRKAARSAGAPGPLRSQETPELVAEYLRESNASGARKSRRPQRLARRAGDRKTHG